MLRSGVGSKMFSLWLGCPARGKANSVVEVSASGLRLSYFLAASLMLWRTQASAGRNIEAEMALHAEGETRLASCLHCTIK